MPIEIKKIEIKAAPKIIQVKAAPPPKDTGFKSKLRDRLPFVEHPAVGGEDSSLDEVSMDS
jgi:hypothetical protein